LVARHCQQASCFGAQHRQVSIGESGPGTAAEFVVVAESDPGDATRQASDQWVETHAVTVANGPEPDGAEHLVLAEVGDAGGELGAIDSFAVLECECAA